MSFARNMGQPNNLSCGRTESAVQLYRRTFDFGRRGTVAILIGLTAPMLTMAIALGIEISGWTVTKQRLQRTADVAAIAAAQSYMRGATAKVAATNGAHLAEINGAKGLSGTSPTWMGSTLSDNYITIQQTTVNTNTAFVATVQTVAPLLFSQIAAPPAITTKTISATATAAITTSAGTGGQPCLVSLEGTTNGVTTGTGINISGATTITANGCTLRSNDSISISGSGSVTSSALYASGAITTSGSSTITGTQYGHQAQISNPYASWTPMQNALANAACSGGAAVNLSGASITLNPGCYTGINASAGSAITLNPGVYYVNGGINLSGHATMAGTGVTLISTGIFGTSGNVNVTLSAPTSGSTAGIVYASTSTNGSSFSGNQTMSFTGLVYYPNGGISFSGNAGSTGCAELVALTLNLSGSVSLATTCTSYGLPTYGSLPGPTTVSLIQ